MKRNLANYVRLQLFSFKKFAYSPMPTNVFLIFFFFLATYLITKYSVAWQFWQETYFEAM